MSRVFAGEGAYFFTAQSLLIYATELEDLYFGVMSKIGYWPAFSPELFNGKSILTSEDDPVEKLFLQLAL